MSLLIQIHLLEEILALIAHNKSTFAVNPFTPQDIGIATYSPTTAVYVLEKAGLIYMFMNGYEQLLGVLRTFLIEELQFTRNELYTNQMLLGAMTLNHYVNVKERNMLYDMLSYRNRFTHSALLHSVVTGPHLVQIVNDLISLSADLIYRIKEII